MAIVLSPTPIPIPASKPTKTVQVKPKPPATPPAATPEPTMSKTPITVKLKTTPEFVKERKAFLSDLLLLNVVVCEPTWRLQMLEAEVAAKDAAGETAEVKGKVTTPCFKLDWHEAFDQLRDSNNRINRIVSKYSIIDADDSFRLISLGQKEEFLQEISDEYDRRMAVAKMLDSRFDDIKEAVKKEYPNHYYQIENRMPTPPFGPRLEMRFSLRPIAVLSPDQMDWSKLSTGTQNKLLDKMKKDAETMVTERIQSVVDGVMAPVLDLAIEINGQKPNPKFDPTKEAGPGNLKYMPGIDSGKKRGSFIEELLVVLERVKNFGQFMPASALAQVAKAVDTVKLAGNASNLNTNSVLQNAIKLEINQLSTLIKEHAESYRPGRSTVI